MPTTVELVAGTIGVVAGVAWMIWPSRMRALQMTYLYIGMSGVDEEQTDTQVLIGRVTGALLAALGVVLALGLVP